MRDIKFRVWNPNANKFVAYAGVNEMPLHEAGALILKVPVYEILQYTGLKDKNGVEIYEGDIVRRDGKILSIEWHPDKAAFTTSSNFGDESRYSRRPLMFIGNYEVIGNIYENPELLESKYWLLR